MDFCENFSTRKREIYSWTITCTGPAVSFVTKNTATNVSSFGVGTYGVRVTFITLDVFALIEIYKLLDTIFSLEKNVLVKVF